jgi:hypothetical protein
MGNLPCIPARAASVSNNKRFAAVPPRAATLSGLGAHDLRVLIAIAGHANGDGEAYPSLARIAALTGIGRRHVPRSIARLEDAGLLRRNRRKDERGGWDRSTYEIVLEEPVSRNTRESVGAPVDDARDDFDVFWRAYPSRSPHDNPRKPAALKFAAAIKRGVKPELIIAGTQRYADYVRRNVSDRKYVKQAVHWLNQEQWNERYGPTEPMPLRAGMI